MTLQALKNKWQAEINNWTVKNLKADDEFMADSFNYPDFAEYVLSVKPTMANRKAFVVKFKRPVGIIVPAEVKEPQIEPVGVVATEPEPVEAVPKVDFRVGQQEYFEECNARGRVSLEIARKPYLDLVRALSTAE